MGDEIPTNPEVNKTPAVAPVASPVVPLEVPEERGKKMFMIIGVVAAVIVVLVIGVVFLSMGGGEDSDLENGEVAGDEGSDSGASGNTPEETPPVDESGPGADDQSVGDEVPPISEKDGALEFSLKVVKSYFDKDCDTYYNSYQETIYLLDDDGPVEKSSYNKERLKV